MLSRNGKGVVTALTVMQRLTVGLNFRFLISLMNKTQKFGSIRYRKGSLVMMCLQNRETFIVLLLSGMVVCLLLIGCRDKSRDHYNRGLAHAKNGEYDQAISEFTKAIEINPQNADAYNNRGNAYRKKGQHDLVISDCTRAIEINPGLADAYYNRAVAYDNKGFYDQAISDLDKAIEINPKLPGAYNSRAIAYYHKAEYDKAWQDIGKAQALGSPVHPGFLNALREASGRER
jgi:tetratricopeptide (TPR) repeat protein